MKPSFHPEGLFTEMKAPSKSHKRSKPVTQLWQLNGRCPKGTVPIRRTKREDVLRANSISRFGKKKHRTFPQPKSADPDLISQSGHQVTCRSKLLPLSKNPFLLVSWSWWFCFSFSEFLWIFQHAIVYVEGDKYYGAKATINVWEPKIQQPNEFSLSQMWILGGSFGEDLNSIEVGWQVLFLFLFLFSSNLTKEILNYPCPKFIFELSTNFFHFEGKIPTTLIIFFNNYNYAFGNALLT